MPNKFRKKPITVEAEQALYDGSIMTLEGEMSYSAGDWIITGVKGERYPIKNEIFNLTYEHVAMPNNDSPLDRAIAEIERTLRELVNAEPDYPISEIRAYRIDHPHLNGQVVAFQKFHDYLTAHRADFEPVKLRWLPWDEAAVPTNEPFLYEWKKGDYDILKHCLNEDGFVFWRSVKSHSLYESVELYGGKWQRIIPPTPEASHDNK